MERNVAQAVKDIAFILMILFFIGCIIFILLAFLVFAHTFYMNVFLILFIIFLVLGLAMSFIVET